MNRRPGLDAVRFAAAMMVVLTHFGARAGGYELPFGPWGGNGVSVFFVLSGYLLWRPFVDGQPDLGRYAIARAARILPAYWLACLVLVPLRGGSLLGFMVMQPDVTPDPLGILWTLQAEVMFYVALPFLGLLRKPMFVPIAFGIASLGIELAIAGTVLHGGPAESWLPVRFWAFAPGMLLAALRPRTDWRWLVVGAAALCVAAATLPFFGGQWTSIPAAIGAFLVVGWGINARPAWSRLWAAGAAISFGLYLWHVDLIELLGPVGMPAAFVVAAVSYRYLEAPVMRWATGLRIGNHRWVLGAEFVRARVGGIDGK